VVEAEAARNGLIEHLQAADREGAADPEWTDNVTGDLEWFGPNGFGDDAIVLRARIKRMPGQQ